MYDMYDVKTYEGSSRRVYKNFTSIIYILKYK